MGKGEGMAPLVLAQFGDNHHCKGYYTDWVDGLFVEDIIEIRFIENFKEYHDIHLTQLLQSSQSIIPQEAVFTTADPVCQFQESLLELQPCHGFMHCSHNVFVGKISLQKIGLIRY